MSLVWIIVCVVWGLIVLLALVYYDGKLDDGWGRNLKVRTRSYPFLRLSRPIVDILTGCAMVLVWVLVFLIAEGLMAVRARGKAAARRAGPAETQA